MNLNRNAFYTQTTHFLDAVLDLESLGKLFMNETKIHTKRGVNGIIHFGMKHIQFTIFLPYLYIL
jgi:hypothetical protein